MPLWQAWGFAITAALVVVVGLGAWGLWPKQQLSRLPSQHIAAATIIGLIGWVGLVDVLGSIPQFTAAGFPGMLLTPTQAFILGNFVFVVASAFAVFGILRRQVWGVALGISVSVARVLFAVLAIAGMLSSIGLGATDDLWGLVARGGLQAAPAVVAIALLVWPLRSGGVALTSMRSPPVDGVPGRATN